MNFNYEQFRVAFRKAAKVRGIDPIEGANAEQAAVVRYSQHKPSFQVALENAQSRSDLHEIRLSMLVRATAKRQAARRWFPSEGRGFLRDDYAIDEALIVKAEDPDWWKHLDADDWRSGGGSLVERQAFAAIRRDVEAARPPAPRTNITLEDMGEATREVLKENPTQAAMRANLSQKESV